MYILYLHNVICQLYINKARKKDSWINHMMGQSRQLPHKIIKQFSKSTCLFPFGLLLILVIVFCYLFVITWPLTVVFPYLHHIFFISSGFLLSLKRKKEKQNSLSFSQNIIHALNLTDAPIFHLPCDSDDTNLIAVPFTTHKVYFLQQVPCDI